MDPTTFENEALLKIKCRVEKWFRKQVKNDGIVSGWCPLAPPLIALRLRRSPCRYVHQLDESATSSRAARLLPLAPRVTTSSSPSAGLRRRPPLRISPVPWHACVLSALAFSALYFSALVSFSELVFPYFPLALLFSQVITDLSGTYCAG